MTQMDLAASAQATAFALLTESASAPHQLDLYRGVLTPGALDALPAESAALTSSTAGHDLGWVKRIAVRGEDRFRWLSGMVTNKVNDLGENAGAWNLVLDAKGRILGDLTVWREGDNLELEIEADQSDHLLEHLNRFIVMDDVELVPLSGDTAVGLTGPHVHEVLQRLSMPVLSEPMTIVSVEWNGLKLRIARHFGALAAHYNIWAPEALLGKLWQCLRAAGANPVGSQSLEAFRIAEGIPAFGIDMLERDLPQETSQMRALNFNKGCYLGQEIVERIRSRGNVHKHLRSLELDGPVPAAGTDLINEAGAVAGQIRSAASLPLASGSRGFALAMMRSEAEIAEQTFTYATPSAAGTARILEAPPKFK